MPWLIVTLISYFILAAVYLVDKHLLVSAIPNPKVYTFYVGSLATLIVLLIPFIDFYLPSFHQIIISLLAGIFFTYALFWFYKGLNLFEASRFVPAIGGLVPLFTFVLVYLFSGGKEILPVKGILAFILLLLGSILITLKKEKLITFQSLKISALTSLLLSFSFVLTKYVYLEQPFLNGLIWIKIGGFLVALGFFLFSKEVRRELVQKRISFQKKTMGIFVTNQIFGAGASILQNWAIALAPLAYLAIINALQGVQYAFLLIFTIFLSIKFPQILKEEISQKVLLQKIFAIILIGLGLVILTLK